MKNTFTLITFLFSLSFVSIAQQPAVDPLTISTGSGGLCPSQTCKVLNVIARGGVPPYHYLWSSGDTTEISNYCNLKIKDQIIVQVRDSIGTLVADTIEIIASEVPQVTVTQQKLACSCKELNALGAVLYYWIDPFGITINNGQLRVCNENDVTYQVIGASLDGCKDTIMVPVKGHPKPVAEIKGKNHICLGDTVVLTAYPLSQANYIWGPGNATGNPVTISPTSTLTETVTVIDSNGCVAVDTFTIFVDNSCTIGILESSKEPTQIKIYPNPLETAAIISLETEQKNAIVKLIDILGKEVRSYRFSGKQLQLDKGELRPGIYFIQINADTETFRSMRIVIQ
jgi:hypothetical protein